jgi:hypothetical protein
MPGAFARQHPGAKNVAQAGQFGREAHRIADWLGAEGLVPDQMPRVRAGALRLDARYLLDGGAYGAALRAYIASLRVHPPTALREWHRILFAGLGSLGLGRLSDLYYRLKRRRPLDSWPELQQVEALYSPIEAGRPE